MLAIWVGHGVRDRRENPDRQSPEVGQYLPDVVAAGAKHGEAGVTDEAFQGTSGEAAIGFHVASFSCDGATAKQACDQLWRQAAADAADQHTGSICAMAAVSTVPQRASWEILAVTAQISPDPTGMALQLFQRLAHPLELFGMSVSTDLQRQPRGRSGVGRMGDGLFHHASDGEWGSPHFSIIFDVNRHAPHAVLIDDAGLPPGSDRLSQHPLNTFLTNALSPAGQRGGIDRKRVLEEHLTGEVLALRVFNSAGQDRHVRQPIGVLQIE